MENVGGGIGQDPVTEVTHLGLNQPSVVFFPVIVEDNIILCITSMNSN